MNPEQQAALEKIKKLLRMKRGGTPDEIATALRLAQELAEKHGINLGSVNPDEDTQAEKPVGHGVPVEGSRIQWEAKYAALVCEKFFHVNAFTHHTAWRKYRIVLVGTDWDREVAAYVFVFLTRHFRQCWRQAKRVRNRQAFLWGMYLGLCQKLSESQAKPVENALVLIGRAAKRREQYIRDNFGETTSHSARPDSDAQAAKWAGWHEGQNTNIRPAVPGGAPKAREITC
jgi:hypothetical protein